jgi:hypothetical protein
MMGKHLAQRRLESAVVREDKKLVISKLHQNPTTKMPMFLSPTDWETNLTQPRILPCSHSPQMINKSLSRSRALWGMCSLGKRVRRRVRKNRLNNRVERNKVSNPNPSLNLSSCGFIVTIVEEMVTSVSFSSRGSVRREWRKVG